MIEIEINPARIIHETRKNKEVFTISSSEMDFVASHPALSDSEKLIWLMIAKHTAKELHLSSSFTCQQIAAMVAKKTETILLHLYTLEAMGFLTINIDAGQVVDCSLSLPLNGLLALKKALKRKRTDRRIPVTDLLRGEGMKNEEGLHAYYF